MKTSLHAFLALHLGLAAGLAQPVITNQPQSQTNIVGATVVFSVGATGAPPLSYQWVFNTLNNRLPGATNGTLILLNVQASNAGIYRVVITNAAGSVQSASARLTVVTPPVITPANPTASLFADVTLVATNNSSFEPQSYQWLFNGEPIAGAVTNRLVVTNVQKTNAGNYAIVATYALGSATSQVATLKITPFNSIYFFGDSWTDTGGNGCNWPPPDYYGNRACNGPMWPEFLTASLGLTYGTNTTNVAHCGDTTADILVQVTNRIRPTGKPALSLYASILPGLDLFVMYPGGYRGEYINPTNHAAITRKIDTAVQNVSNTVQNLYQKGARSFFYFNQSGTNAPDIPLLGWEGAALFEAHARSYNTQFNAAMNAIRRQYADVRIYVADLYTLWDAVSTQPASYGFTDILTPGWSETNHAFDGPGASHLYWDRTAGHATSKFNALMAALSLDTLRASVFEGMKLLATNQTAHIEMSHLLIGRDYTLQSSSDLASWNIVQTFTASAGTNQVTHPLSTATASVFYRLQWQP